MTGTRMLEPRLDRRAIGETHGCAGGIDHELALKIAGKLLFIGQQKAFEIAYVAEFAAVGKLTAGIHRQGVMKGKLLSALAEARLRRAVAFRTVTIPPATHNVEILQRQTCRVNLCVAGGAGL